MEGLNNKKSKDSAVNNVVKEEAFVAGEIDYLYDDLSNIDTATLKIALKAYIDLDLKDDGTSVRISPEKTYKNFDENNGALVRIEAELLGRKELEVDENLFSEN